MRSAVEGKALSVKSYIKRFRFPRSSPSSGPDEGGAGDGGDSGAGAAGPL